MGRSEAPFVSVIIPTYNRAKLLGRAVESALHQTYRNVEIIVVDDGSTDRTKEVVRSFGARIHYLSSEHKGTAHARNLGMRAATGKYIAFLDSDDTYLPFKLDLQVEFIEKHPAVGMVCTEFSGLHEDGQFQEYLLRDYHPVWREKKWTYEDVFNQSGNFFSSRLGRTCQYYIGSIFKYVLQDTLIATNTILFHRNILSIVGYQDESYRFGQEYEFVVRICKNFQVAFLDIPTYVLVFHKNQSTACLMKSSKSEEDELLDIEVCSLLKRTVVKWGYRDDVFYEKHKHIVDGRLSELNYALGKKWLRIGHVRNAKNCFKASYVFQKLNFKLYAYWILSHLPHIFVEPILRITK